MRTGWTVAFLLVVFPLVGAQAPLDAGHEVAAPAAFQAATLAVGDNATLHHVAGADAAVTGVLLHGRIWETVEDDAGGGRNRVVHVATPSAPIPISLKAGSVVAATLGPGVTVAGQDARTTVWWGPNPVRQAAEDRPLDLWRFLPAMPTGSFLAVADGPIAVRGAMELTVWHGNVTLQPPAVGDVIERAGLWTEPAPGPGPLDALMMPQEPVAMLRVLRVEAWDLRLVVAAGDADATHAAWAGEPVGTPAPMGAWPRERLGGLEPALAARGLSSTSLAFDVVDLQAGVLRTEGVAGGGGRVYDAPARLAATALGQTHSSFEIRERSSAPATGASAPAWVAVAGGAVAIVVVASPWGRRQGAWMLGWLLYARISDDAFFDHPLRREVRELLRREPGLGVRDLAQRTGHPGPNVAYHLAQMVRREKAITLRIGRHRRFFLPDGLDRLDKRALALWREPGAHRMASLIQQEPGLRQRDVCQRLDLAPSTVGWHAERLARWGLIERRKDGHAAAYFPTDRLMRLGQAAEGTR